MYFFCQAEDGIRDSVASRGLGDVYKVQSNSYSYTMSGRDGTDWTGRTGRDGLDWTGRTGLDGTDWTGRTGRDGLDGTDWTGRDGLDGTDGRTGRDGLDGTDEHPNSEVAPKQQSSTQTAGSKKPASKTPKESFF